jgi:hypothetical protein
MRIALYYSIVLSVLVLGSTSSFAQSSWDVFKSDDYGFSMLVPKNSQGGAFEKNGWGGLQWNANGVKLLGLARKGSYKNDLIRANAAQISGIPANAFTLVDKGAKKNGWTWFETYRATDGANIVLAIVGEGPNASYILYLVTTVADFQANQATYFKWFGSLTVFKAKKF